MEYYVIYDKDDNLVAYCENIEELSNFVNRRKRELKYRFKDRNVFNIQVPTLFKIYKFSWGVVPRLFLCYLLFIGIISYDKINWCEKIYNFFSPGSIAQLVEQRIENPCA